MQTTTPDYRTMMTTIQPLTTYLSQISERMDLERENTIVTPKKLQEKPKPIQNKTKTEDTNYSGFIPLLNTIQQTLTHNAKKSLKSKISLLTNLRDNLLANIGKFTQFMFSPVKLD